MTLRYSTGLRNYILSSGIRNAFNSGLLEIRSGTQPVNANDAPTGLLLSTIILPSNWMDGPAGGVIPKLGVWSGNVDVAGTASWFRIKRINDLGGTSVIDLRLDGSVGLVASGEDIEADDIVYDINDTIIINDFNLTYPAEAS